MPQSVTANRRQITLSATTITFNWEILKTPSTALKLLETVIGAVCLGLVSYYSVYSNRFLGDPEHTFFFLVTFAFLMTTFLMLISAILSLMSATVLPKTLFEFLYHVFAFIFYISASLALIVTVSSQNKHYKTSTYEGKMAAAVLGLVNSVLYLISAFFSFRGYKMG